MKSRLDGISVFREYSEIETEKEQKFENFSEFSIPFQVKADNFFLKYLHKIS